MKYKLQVWEICISPYWLIQTTKLQVWGNLILVVGVRSLCFCDISPTKVTGFKHENQKRVCVTVKKESPEWKIALSQFGSLIICKYRLRWKFCYPKSIEITFITWFFWKFAELALNYGYFLYWFWLINVVGMFIISSPKHLGSCTFGIDETVEITRYVF